MLSLISTLGGLLISGLPSLLNFFQNKADQKHERELAKVQADKELAMAKEGFAAQARIEEIRTEQVAMQTNAQMAQAEAEMTKGAQEHDKVVLSKASRWVANYVGTVRPTVTYLFVFELIAINAWIAYYVFVNPGLVPDMAALIQLSDIIFSAEEMSMLGGIIGFWFGSRGWAKK
jgi:ABC-type multidrug transport system fused ATPase/permease subunit